MGRSHLLLAGWSDFIHSPSTMDTSSIAMSPSIPGPRIPSKMSWKKEDQRGINKKHPAEKRGINKKCPEDQRGINKKGSVAVGPALMHKDGLGMFYRHFWGGKNQFSGLGMFYRHFPGWENQFSRVLINVRVDKEGV